MRLVSVVLILSILVQVTFANPALGISIKTPISNVHISQRNNEEKERAQIIISRITLGICSAGFLGLGVYYNSKANQYFDEYRVLSHGSQSYFDDSWSKVEEAERKRTLFYGLSAASAVGFSLTFAF